MRALIIAMTLLAGTFSAAIVALTGGCATQPSAPGTDAATAATTQPVMAAAASDGKSGAQLWSDNCRRCHNLRGPESFSPAQWDVIVHHMRLRANLTGEEARKVTAFLKSAS
jgi:cytochrome c5